MSACNCLQPVSNPPGMTQVYHAVPGTTNPQASGGKFARARMPGTTPGNCNTKVCTVPARHIDAPAIAAASVSPSEMRPAVPMECAEQPMETPRTNGDETLKTAGQSSSKALPREAPMQPVMRIEATASFGSHSGPTAQEPSMPSADITDRCNIGKDRGGGTLSGDCGATAPMAVARMEKHPEALHVAKTHLKSSGLSSHLSVVLYIRTPSPVTAAGSHWKSLSPTPTPLSKYGATGPTYLEAKFDETAQITSGCNTLCALSGSSLAKAKEPTVVLISQSMPMGRCKDTGNIGEHATPK
mmetsp:Transcript_130067/g.324239  ORF Transcript_130067/g.324239 Transcript_130067/m.324239 type:complete len:299 (-) Transcript_130067:788-1684(-)